MDPAAAAALATGRIRRGRPLAKAAGSRRLDRLTGGGLVLGVGSVRPWEVKRMVLAERLDESLLAIDLLWSGEPVTYRGNQITINDVVFNRPRCSVRGCRSGSEGSGRTRRRCAEQRGGTGRSRWSGPASRPHTRRTSARSADLVAFLRGCRAENGLAERPFDIVVGGMSPAEPAAGRDLVGPLADLGITWWDERMPWGDALERAEPILRRIDQGPPRI